MDNFKNQMEIDGILSSFINFPSIFDGKSRDGEN